MTKRGWHRIFSEINALLSLLKFLVTLSIHCFLKQLKVEKSRCLIVLFLTDKFDWKEQLPSPLGIFLVGAIQKKRFFSHSSHHSMCVKGRVDKGLWNWGIPRKWGWNKKWECYPSLHYEPSLLTEASSKIPLSSGSFLDISITRIISCFLYEIFISGSASFLANIGIAIFVIKHTIEILQCYRCQQEIFEPLL